MGSGRIGGDVPRRIKKRLVALLMMGLLCIVDSLLLGGGFRHIMEGVS